MDERGFRGRATVFSINGCTHCINAKELLSKLSIPFIEIPVDQYDSSVRTQLVTKTKQRSLPQVFFNSKFIGGYEELVELASNKEKLEENLNIIREESPDSSTPALPDASLMIVPRGAEASPEPDEYGILVREMKNDGVVKDIRRGFTKYTNCFTGRQLVDWLVEKRSISRERAAALGQSLVSRHFGHSVPPDEDEVFHDNETIYRLLEDDESDALNAGLTPSYESRSPKELGQEIHRTILNIFSEFVSPDGRKVDYRRIQNSNEFLDYVQLTKELHCIEIANASRAEKLAFFINIYNALVIHATVVKGHPSNMFQRWKFFNTVRYLIGGYTYTLQDIENGVLRANSKGVAQIFRPFGSHDPRLRVALSEPEPLVHFALVCGAKSCPAIRVYDVNEIEDQLLFSAQAFLESDEVEVDVNSQTVTLSSIFKWFRHDFGRNDQEVLEWIEGKLPDGSKRESLSTLLRSGRFRIAYKHYDWSVNAKAGRMNRSLYGKSSCRVATVVFHVVVCLTLLTLGIVLYILLS